MTIERTVIRNFKGLKETDLTFGKGLNILVGDNETGKSTVLEAINLALTKQLNRRDVGYDLHPFLFHQSIVQEFVQSVRDGLVVPPLEIDIEVYLTDVPELAEHKGTNNSRNVECPGVRLRIELDEKFREEYQAYIAETERIRTVPVEFFHVDWRNFADEPLTSRSKPLRPALIDPSALTNTYAANRYVLELARDFLTRMQKVDLALSYRQLREAFQTDASVAAINQELAKQKGVVSDRELSVALDMSARSNWDTSVTPHLDDLPLTLVGKGEQTSVKVKLALEGERSLRSTADRGAGDPSVARKPESSPGSYLRTSRRQTGNPNDTLELRAQQAWRRRDNHVRRHDRGPADGSSGQHQALLHEASRPRHVAHGSGQASNSR